MRVRGDLEPNNAFTLEDQPKKAGKVLARFFENVTPFEETDGDLTISGYEYDEYHLELDNYDSLFFDILNSYDGYLAQAKLAEAEQKTIPDLQQQVATLAQEKAELNGKVESLELQLTDTQMALCDVYELALGG